MRAQRWLGVGLALLVITASTVASASAKKLVVGVYVPGSIADGHRRFEFAEAFAKALGTSLGREGVARNFGRFEDFSSALGAGMFDVAVVDGWVLAQSRLKLTPVAAAVPSQDVGGRWVMVSRTRATINDLQGKKLAVLKAPHNRETTFLSNVVFMGDLDARKHFKLVPVPDVESALKALEAKTVDVAFVPAGSHGKELHVVYRAPRLPGAMVTVVKGESQPVEAAVLAMGALGPFEKFVSSNGDEVRAVAHLVTRGAPRRMCIMAESPLVRVEPKAVIRFSEVGRVMPSFTDFFTAPKEQPDE